VLQPGQNLNADERGLLKSFRALDAGDRDTLIKFAEFLASHKSDPQPLGLPKPIPRPQKESVVAAIRRLSDTYCMLDKDAMLHEVSAMMAEHVLQGKPAADVIDVLEQTFRRHYELLKRET
jgi:hypothetical protein